MSWLEPLFWPVIVVAGFSFTVLVSFLLATLYSGRKINQVEQHLTAKIRRLNDRIADQPRSYGPAAYERAPPGRNLPAYAPQRDRPPPRPGADHSYQENQPSDPQPPPRDQAADQNEAAASALADRDSFRVFVERHGGTGYSLRQGAATPIPSDSDGNADLWAIACPEGMHIYPGYNLRRTQSSLVADSGRVAEQRLGFLFDIETGSSLRAIRPALVANDWSMIRRGTLQVTS